AARLAGDREGNGADGRSLRGLLAQIPQFDLGTRGPRTKRAVQKTCAQFKLSNLRESPANRPTRRLKTHHLALRRGRRTRARGGGGGRRPLGARRSCSVPAAAGQGP